MRKRLQIAHLKEGLYLKYIKNPQVSRVNKKSNPIRKWAKEMNRHFSEEIFINIDIYRDIRYITHVHIKYAI